MKYYKCEICGNVIEFLNASGAQVTCCGQQMTELIPGTSDGAAEKHVPFVTIDGPKVTVAIGEVEHPSTEAHYIQWISLETTKGVHRINLLPGDTPRAEFILTESEEPLAAYEYCNLHNLWMAKI